MKDDGFMHENNAITDRLGSGCSPEPYLYVSAKPDENPAATALTAIGETARTLLGRHAWDLDFERKVTPALVDWIVKYHDPDSLALLNRWPREAATGAHTGVGSFYHNESTLSGLVIAALTLAIPHIRPLPSPEAGQSASNAVSSESAQTHAEIANRLSKADVH